MIKDVACAVWRFSSGNSCRTIGKVFGLGWSTVSQFCKEMREISHRFIPKTKLEVSLPIQKFRKSVNCKVPQVVRAIDETHIEICVKSLLQQFL